MSKEKNAQIKATLLATKERRKTQKCFVFSTKIDYRKLNKSQKEQLQMLFVEAKWVYNDIINHLQDNELSSWNDKKKSVMVKQKDGSFVEKPLIYFKSAMMQGMKSLVGDSLNSLAEKKGYKVGKLKFKSSFSSIPLKQFGNTHRIKSLTKVGITGISGNFRVHGLEQFADNPNAEIANAKLIKKPDGYYIHWTVYIAKNKLPVIHKKAHRMFVLNEKRKRRNRKDEAFTNGWDSLMYECIDIETASDAKSYFHDVENLAKKLKLLCSDGKPFKASDAIKEWYWVEEQIEKSVQDLLDKYGEDVDGLPVIGLKYYGHDDTLAIGIYDNGDFTSCVGWEFRESMTHKLRVDDYDAGRYSRTYLNNV